MDKLQRIFIDLNPPINIDYMAIGVYSGASKSSGIVRITFFDTPGRRLVSIPIAY